MRSIIVFLSLAGLASAQIVTFGGKVGVPVTAAWPFHSSGQYADTGRWTAGPTAEFRLPARLSIEIDGLFRQYRVITDFPIGVPGLAASLVETKRDTNAWDFPVLLKYRLTEGPIRPFVNAGYQYTHESTTFRTRCLNESGACAAALIQPRFEESLDRSGPVAGGGLEFRYWKLRLAPEVRYTRLNKPGMNQVTLLFGVTF
jgi:hypothetical protein